MRRKHRRYTMLLFVMALMFVLMSVIGPRMSQAAPSANAIVQRAWQRAQQVGVYHFTTELAQTTYPAPMVRNAGRATQVETLYMEGSVNTPAHQMELLLRPQGGSALSLRDSFEVRIDGDEAYGRSPGGEWQALHGFSDAFAPAGDLLAYLAGAENVREVEAGRYRYDLDGPAFAAYVRDQLERYLIQQGELPPSLSLQSADLYHDVQGEGEVWLTDAGLPARLAVALAYPPAPDGERVTAQVTTDFFGFPEPTGGVLQRYVAPALTRSPGAWYELAQQVGLALGSVSFLSLLVLRRGSRALYAVVVLILIASMVAAPVVESVKAAGFLDRQAEKQAQFDAEEAARDEAARAQAELTSVDWDPQQNPMERPASEREALTAGAETASFTGAEADEPIMDLCTDDERTTDTDEDGLTDCDERTRYLTDVHRADTDGDTLLDGWEVLRLGTLPIADLGADSDGDGIGDGLEVVGFTFRGQSWYSDPNTPDSDGDGRHDGLECPQRLDAGGETSIDPATPCVDTDDDGVPDLFDLDSDDDGVPDKLDLSPLTVRGQATPFGRTAPFQLLVNNLQSRPDGEGGYFPTLLDLQIRPVNPEHLTYALNVLDWPSGDELGQIQRRRGNDSTFADAMSPAQGAADPRAANGDVRLIPMLEIELSGANLPFPMTTARTTLRWQNTFDIALRFTQQEGLIEAHLVEPATGEQSYGFQIYEGVCGDLGDPTGLRFTLSSDQSVGTLIGLGSLLDIADGEHVIVADNDAAQQDLVRACVPINDLPNGDADTQMIDTEPLRAYGMSVRDKDHQGTVLVYAPLNVVPDETGGGRTAFSARILYQPQAANLGDVAQQMRVVWMVQALSDWCNPMPADISDEAAEDWCDSAENWSLDNPQLVHTYYEDWYLTGLSVREDHGLNVAVAWEDPATRSPDALRYEDWLWILANDLATVFLAGRDQDDNGVRDLGVATETAGFLLADSTLEQRFDAPLDPTITAVDRFGIPLTVTFGVETFAYPNQDHVAHVMMSESERILQENFGAYPEATPTLLFAREEMYRLTSLSDGASGDGPVVSLDFAERDVKVLSALNWAPYRYRENAWRAYPIDEYWQQMEVLLTGLFTYNPAFPEEMMRDIRAGEMMLARAYYLSLNQGHVSLVQVNDTPVNRHETEQTDASLAASLAETVALKGARSAALIKIITEELADALASALTKLANFSVEWDLNRMSYSGRFGITKRDILLKTLGRSIYNTVNDGSPSALTKLLDKVKAKLGKLHNKLYGESPSLVRKVGVSTSLVIGVIAIVATLLTLLPIGFFFADTALMLQVCINAAVATVMIVLLIKTLDDVNDIFKAFKAAGTVTAQSVGRIAYITAVVSKEVQNMSKVTMVCAVIGLIIGVAVAFGGLMATLIIGKMTPGSLAANAAFAEAVAYTIVAVILFAISLIPVVGQIIAGVIAAIDGLIAVACAIGSAIAGEDVSQRPGGWACRGISGLAAELIKGFIYNAIVMVDISDPDRLVFDAFDISLSDPDLGLSAGNAVRYRASLTNTIERKKVLPPTAEMIENWKKGDLIPVDWKSLSYAWQFNDRNAKKTIFDYRWQTEEDDIGGLDFGSMRDDWQSTGEDRTFYMQADPASPPIPLGEAGLNQRPTLYLSEGYVLPVQECWIVVEPSPHCATPATARIPYVCAIPVCKVRHQSNTSHLDLGDRFIMDIFPPTLDEFYQPAAKSGGYSPAWTQTPTAASGGVSRFPVQLDFDGDTLLVPAKGGADPDDSRWDTDGDGINDAFEYQNGSDPTLYDTDRDGLNDTEELRLGTDPRRKDSDGDGLTDGEELQGWEIVYAFDEAGEQLRTSVTSDPLVIDADDDGLSDFKEKVYGFNPDCPSDPVVLEMASAAREGDAPRLLLRFDEPAGSETFADASGYGKTALCLRGGEWCPTSTDGRYVYGLHFDGRDMLNVSHSELNALRNDFTIAAWIKPEDPSDWEVNLIATARTESDNGFRLYYSENDLYFETYGIHTYSLPDAGLQAGRWSHVAVVMGADNAVTFYVDGIARGTEAFSAPANPDPDDDLLIGGATYPGEQEPYHAFQGDLDEVAFFDRALVPGEVAALVEARYNPNDLIVQPGATVAYTATLTNKLYDRYAQGLHSVASVQSGALAGALPPETFILQPIEVSTLEGEVQIAEAGATTSSGPFTLTQQVNAQITDWREASNFAELWLPLNDVIGGASMTFADQSGSVPPRDAVCAGASCPTPHVGGYFDDAVGFNGVASLTLPSTRRLGFEGGSFTLSAWVKGTDFSPGQLRTIMGTDLAHSPSISFLMHGRQPAMRLDGQLLTAGGRPLNPRAWYHLVFRYDAYLGEQSIYVNGERRGVQMGITPFTGSGTVYLGRAGTGFGFAGAIDDVRTFQRALSLDEIRALYNRPVMRLPFEDDDFRATRRAFDASGFGNTARCNNNTCPEEATGIYGEQAARFSGEDYLTVSDDASVDLGEGQFTIAAWLWRDHLAADWDEPQGILGRYTGVDDTGVSTSGNERYSYPSLFNVDGKVRFGYGTGDVWVTRTTSDTVLTEESWNHVVLSFGPEYRLDGTFEQYRAVLYVNNVVRADWGMGEAPPAALESDFFVGRASDKAEIYVDRFKVLRQADESPHCEIRMSWNDEEIDEWGGLDPDEERDVHFSAVFRNEGKLRAWEDDDGAESGHNYSDDPLCDIELNNCENQGEVFSTNDPTFTRRTLDWEGDDKDSSEGLNHEDRTRIEIYLGASGKPAFANPSIPFHGRMDELTLYKRPLSTAEVQELYFSASMAMRLPFDDPPGSKTFRDTVDVSLQGGAYCSGSACPTAGVNGRENQAALFDGVDDVVHTDLYLDQSADAGGATLAAWARPTGASPGIHDVIRGARQGWSLVRDGDIWRVYDGANVAALSAPVDVGVWQHLVAVFDPHAGVTLYKNGVAIDTTGLLYTNDAKARLSVGASFDGMLDDVRVFNRPLAPGDVETLYHRVPVFQLHLDEPHGGSPPFRDVAGGLAATCQSLSCPASGLGGQVSLAAGFNLNRFTKALVFDRTPALQSQAFTLGAWVLPTTVRDRGQTLIANGWQSRLYIPADSLFPTLGVYYGNYSERALTSATPLALNQWNHIMGTYDGADLRIYVNGYLQGELATTFDAITDTSTLRIGDQSFVGRLDEVTLYNRALAPDEVRDIFLYQGKLVEAHSATRITVDDEPPVSTLRSYNVAWPYAGPAGVALHVEAHDETSSVSLLELGVDGVYTAAPPCADAVGDASWCPFFDPAGEEGAYQLTTRATDITGHRETPEATYDLYVDATAPDISRTLTSGELVAATRHPTLMGHWIAHLSGTLVDPALTSGVPGSGVDPDAVFVSLHGSEGDPLGVERQLATVVSDTWSIDYVFNGARPTGRYTVTVAASDRMGNGASAAIATRLHMDAAAPAADLDLRDGVAVDQPFSGLVSELPLPQDTLLALRFEEQAGATTFYDSAGGQRHGACIAAVCPTAGVAGISGRAARFDGLYHLVSLSPRSASGLYTFDTGVSMAAWMNPSTLDGQQPIGTSGRARSPDDGFAFRLDGRDLVFETLGVHTYRLAGAGLATGRWTHVAAVLDANHAVTFYVDGVARGTVSHDQPGQADMDDRFFIGSDGAGTGFNGALDEVLVVGRALEADEVRQLAQARAVGVAAVEAAFRPVLPGSPFDHQGAPASLALHLPLDDEADASEVGALTLMDLAGEGATASCVGGACPELNEPGRVGSAVRFDGREDTIALNDFGVFTTTTVAAWIRRDDATGARQTVLAYKERADCGFVLALDGVDAHPYALFNVGGTWVTVEDAAAIPAAAWVHVAASYDGTTARLYRDGQLVGEVVAPGALAQCSAGSAIGSNPTGTGDFFAGALDEVRVYRRALSGAEIEAAYLGRDALLALSFDFGQGWATHGAGVADDSDWRHAANLYTDDGLNKVVVGQMGSHALALDGRDDYVAVAPAPSLALDTIASAFTQAAWVYVEPQDSGLYPIISSAAYDVPAAQYPFVQVIERDRLVVGFGDGMTLHSFTTEPLLTPGAWHHVVGVFDGQTYTIYVDGEPRAATAQFAGLRPASAHRFDVGRGARAEALGCATLEAVAVTGVTWEQQWRVRYQGDVVYESPAYPTAGRAYDLAFADEFCGAVPFELEARAWDPALGWRWHSLGGFDLTPAPGERTHTFSAGGRTGALTWRTTTAGSDLRYFQGQLDAVYLYPYALGPLDVQRLYTGRWLPANLAAQGGDVDVTTWRADAPDGLEGAYEVDTRGWDVAGHADTTGLSQGLWSGELDTLAPRVAITRTVAGDRYHYETVAEDYNLVRNGFSSPCGAGIGEAEPFSAAWYRTVAGPAAPGEERLYRLAAECDTPASGLFEVGAWREQPWITGGAVVVTGTGGTTAYVPAGRLWQVDVSDPARPRLDDIYPSVQHAQGVALNGAHAYVAEGVFGLSVVSLADPTAPAAGYDTPGEAVDVAAAGDYVVVADGSGGLRVVDVRDPGNPVAMGQVATGGDALGVAVSEMPATMMMGALETSEPGDADTIRALPTPISVEPVVDIEPEPALVSGKALPSAILGETGESRAALAWEPARHAASSEAGNDVSPADTARIWSLSLASGTTRQPVLNVQRSQFPWARQRARLFSAVVSAGDDTASMFEDTVLTVDAPGVLTNDTRSDSGALVPTLVSAPTTGTLDLVHTGAFTYTPPLNYYGVVTFTYLATTLRGYWALDEGGGITTTDYCGATGVLTGTNPPQWLTSGLPTVPDDNAAAVTCSGINCRVALGTTYLAGLYPSTAAPLSIVAWVKPEAINLDQNFVASGNYWMGTPTASYRATYLGIRNGNYVIGSRLDSNEYGVSFPIPPEDVGQWVHLAGAYDADTRYWYLYRNGVEVDHVADLTGALGLYDDAFGGAKWVIGGGGGSCSECQLFSAVDDVHIYDDALSSGEVAMLASGSDPDPLLSQLATVTITIMGVNDAPVAFSDAYTTSESLSLNVTGVGVLANDNDVDGDPLTVTLATAPSHGALTLDATGAFTYTPAPYYYGTDTFTYRANDGVLDSLPATVTLTINPVNDPPVAVADVYTPTEDLLFTAGAPGVLDNDQDVENDPLTATLVTTPTHGVLAFVDDGSFQYRPDADFNGADAFTYYAGDGDLDSSVVTVTLNVAAVNDAPVAAGDAYTTTEDVVLNVAAPGVLANDDDVDGDTLHATVVQSPTVGSLTLAGNGALIYEPPLNVNGLVTFTYRVSDGGLTATATVTLTLTAVDDPPDAQPDVYTTNQDMPLTVAAPGLLGNDSDPEGAGMTATLAVAPGYGDVMVDLDGAFAYTPTVGYHGVDTFAYRVSDGGLSATATVTLTVNGPPSAGDVAIFTQEEISTTLRLTPDHTSDPEGDALVVSAVGAPLTGTVIISGTTGVTYTPAPNFSGVETFTYTVVDPGGLTATGRITVTVGGINDAPVAVDDAVTTPEDQPVTVAVLDNDSDPDGQTPQLLSVGAPAQGSAEMVSAAVVYTPPADYAGVDGFDYIITDGVLTATGRVTVTVTSVNDAPTLDALADVALEPNAPEQRLALQGIGTGASNEVQPLSIQAVSTHPALIPHPVVAYDGSATTGELRFTPTAGMTGTATVSVTVSDGLSQTTRAFAVTVWDATGPFAYVAAGKAGLVVIDLSRPESPRRIAQVATPNAARDVTLAGDMVYVAAGAAGLLVVDVSTPVAPVVLATAVTPGFAGGADVIGDQVFVTDGYAGVAQVDVGDPSAPSLVSVSDTPGYASRLMALGHALYVSDGTGGLRIFDTTLPPGQATACDRTGNCTTVAATVVQSMALMATSQENPETGVSILSAPPLLVETGALTVTGKAFALLSSLRALTLTVDHETLYTTTWASGAVSATAWHAPWNSTGMVDGPHGLRATAVAWDGALVTDTVTVTLDTQAPALALATTVLTHAHYQAPGALVVMGQAIDAGGVVDVDLVVGQDVYPATLEGQTWRAPWTLAPEALPDGETFTVTVQATDVAGHVAQITRTLLVDVAPPAPPSLALRHDDTPLSGGMTVRAVSPTLSLTWTAVHDGSGLGGYDVAWLASEAGVQTVVTDTPGLARRSVYTAPEAAKVNVRLGARDVYGQVRWESAGPIYVDGPRTPDYVTLGGVGGIYRGWMTSGCALLGVDRRVMRDVLETSTLNVEQRFYGTWDGEGLRMAWTGANWDTDGDLFVYVDAAPGGTATAFDPYGVTTTTLHLPGVTPTGTVGAMAADALIWVRDAATALLARWDDGAGTWMIQGPLDEAAYHYDAEVNGGQTDLYVPFAQLGLGPGGSFDLVAFATDEGSLGLWATMPNANPLNSDQATTPVGGDGVRFALVHRYHWDGAGAGVCPNGSDGSSPAYPDTEVQVELSAAPEGVAYSLAESDITWLWEHLAGERSADVSSYFSRMRTDHPRVGCNQAITYTLRYRNAGSEPATGLYADVTAHDALRLMPGDSDRRITFGSLAPGEERSMTFRAMVDLTRSPEPWAAVTVELYDDAHPAGGPPLERLWLDHQVDRAPPAFVGITGPAYVLGARVNRIRGYVYDPSPVPGIVLRLEDGTVVFCSDPTPSDGAWACELDTTGYRNGDVLVGRVEAVDLFGQRSAPSAAQRWVVDTAPPTVTLIQPSGAGATLVAERAQFSGMLYDNVGLAGADLCQVAGTGRDVCAPATVRLHDVADVRVVVDAPPSPVSIAGPACGASGTGIVRSMTVTESFTLGSVSVGFSAEHPRRDDLAVTLVAPSGKVVTLLTDDGLSGTAFRNYDVWLDDAASGPYDVRYDDVVKGTFARQARPATPLASLIGEEAAGTWQLVICDSDPAANAGTYWAGQLYLSPEPSRMAARTGTWDYTYRPDTDLDYVAQELRVVGIDLAGNRTTDPLTLSLTVDNVAPVVTMTQLITSALLVEDLMVLTGEVYDGSFAGQAGAAGVQWEVVVTGPGGTTTSSGTRDGAQWSYTLHPPAPGTYRIAVSVYDAAGNVTTMGPYVVEVRPWSHIYMPVIAHNFVPAPDLVVEQVVAGPQGVQVVVANRGPVPVDNGFWVDLYVDPSLEPLEVNQTWTTLGAQGAAWGVTGALDAGAVLTLTVGDAYYSDLYSFISWPLAAGTPIYVQVDSAGDPGYGGVREDHEILRLGYNNIRAAEVGVATPMSCLTARTVQRWTALEHALPPR